MKTIKRAYLASVTHWGGMVCLYAFSTRKERNKYVNKTDYSCENGSVKIENEIDFMDSYGIPILDKAEQATRI